MIEAVSGAKKRNSDDIKMINPLIYCSEVRSADFILLLNSKNRG